MEIAETMNGIEHGNKKVPIIGNCSTFHSIVCTIWSMYMYTVHMDHILYTAQCMIYTMYGQCIVTLCIWTIHCTQYNVWSVQCMVNVYVHCAYGPYIVHCTMYGLYNVWSISILSHFSIEINGETYR